MHELIIYRDEQELTYSEALLLQDLLRAAVTASRKQRTDEYATIEVDFSTAPQSKQHAETIQETN